MCFRRLYVFVPVIIIYLWFTPNVNRFIYKYDIVFICPDIMERCVLSGLQTNNKQMVSRYVTLQLRFYFIMSAS